MKFFLTLFLFILLDIQLYSNESEYIFPVIDNPYGRVTIEELHSFDNYYKNYVPPKNNYERAYSWSLSDVQLALLYMYKITNDIKYIDYLISINSHVLDSRVGPDSEKVDYVTQRVIPAWPFYYNKFRDTNDNPVYYTNIIGSSMVLFPLIHSAKIILENDLPIEYIKEAKLYVETAIEVIEHFLNYSDWYNPVEMLFIYPDNDRHEEVLPGLRGKKIGYNRMLALARVMVDLITCLELLELNITPYIRYKEIITSIVEYYWENTTLIDDGNEPYYLWMYRKEGKKDRPPVVEDIGHGAIDVRCLIYIFNSDPAHYNMNNRQFQYMSNTILNVTQYDEESKSFSYRLDGTERESRGNNLRKQSLKYLPLNQFNDSIYDNNAQLMLSNIKLKNPLQYTEFLYYKWLRYGSIISN